MICMLLLAAATALTFENPVIRVNWSDPTFWMDGDGTCYGVASDLEEVRASRDLLRWEPVGPVIEGKSKAELYAFSENFWAPDVIRIGDEWRLYVTQFVSSDTNRLVCLSSESPRGPFRFSSVVLKNWEFGIRDLAIDAEVVRDGDRVWLFTGSVAGGVHRLELTADGLALRDRRAVHVAGLLPGDRDRKWIYANACYEGAYLYWRAGWWYLFVSAGDIRWDAYHLCCGRSRTLDGKFVDPSGRSLAQGGGKTVLVSNADFPGPGHNGEIVTDGAGADYMFFHAHWSAFPLDQTRYTSRRCLNLQRILWDADGWPYFETGSVKKTEVAPRPPYRVRASAD